MNSQSGQQTPLRGIEIFLMIALGAIWGASFLFMRMAVADFRPIALIEVRLLVGSLVLFGILLTQGNMRQLLECPGHLAVVGLTNSALPYCLFAYATLTVSAGFASVLNATAPFFTAVLGYAVLRESLSPLKWLGLTVGFIGVCALVWDKLQLDAGLAGVAACLVAACSYGIAAHYSRRKLKNMPALIVATGSQITGSLMLLPFALFNLPSNFPALKSWLAALGLGAVCTGFALAVYFYLLNKIGTTRTMIVGYLIPMFGVLWGCIFLGEVLTVPMLLGGVLIISGLACVARG